MKLINYPDIMLYILHYLPSEYILLLYNKFKSIKLCMYLSNYTLDVRIPIDLQYDYEDFPIHQFIFTSYRPYDDKYISKLSKRDVNNLRYLFKNATTVYIINYMYYYTNCNHNYVRHVVNEDNVNALDKFTYIDPNYTFEYGLFDYDKSPDVEYESWLGTSDVTYFTDVYDEQHIQNSDTQLEKSNNHLDHINNGDCFDIDTYNEKEKLIGRNYKVTRYRTSQTFTLQDKEIIEPPIDTYLSHDPITFDSYFLRTAIDPSAEYKFYSDKFIDKLSFSPYANNHTIHLISEGDITIKNTLINNITLVFCRNITIESHIKGSVIMNHCENITIKQNYIRKLCMYEGIENSKFNTIGQLEVHSVKSIDNCTFGNVGIFKGNTINVTNINSGIIDTAIVQRGPYVLLDINPKNVRKLVAIFVNPKYTELLGCKHLNYVAIYPHVFDGDIYDIKLSDCDKLKRIDVFEKSEIVNYDITRCNELKQFNVLK